MSAPRSVATKEAKSRGLRAALAAKTSRITHFDLPIVESEEADAKGKRVTELTNRRDFARVTKDNETVAKLDVEIAEAKADLAACFYRISFKGLTMLDFDALVNEHPPTKEDAKNDMQWNEETFVYALLEASCVNEDNMTAEEWKADLNSGRWTRADRNALFNAVYSANLQDFSAGIPKD